MLMKINCVGMGPWALFPSEISLHIATRSPCNITEAAEMDFQGGKKITELSSEGAGE